MGEGCGGVEVWDVGVRGVECVGKGCGDVGCGDEGCGCVGCGAWGSYSTSGYNVQIHEHIVPELGGGGRGRGGDRTVSVPVNEGPYKNYTIILKY